MFDAILNPVNGEVMGKEVPKDETELNYYYEILSVVKEFIADP